MADNWRKYEQENLVVELACNRETMDEDEFEEKYNSLSPKYQKRHYDIQNYVGIRS